MSSPAVPPQLVLIDWENVQLSLRATDLWWAIVDHGDVDLGVDEVWCGGAHGFDALSQAWLRAFGVHAEWLAYIVQGDGLKNGADIALTIHAVTAVTSHPVRRVVLTASDFDYRPLLRYLGEPPRRVQRVILHTGELKTALRDEADEIHCVRPPGSSPTPRTTWQQVDFPVRRYAPQSAEAMIQALQAVDAVLGRPSVTIDDIRSELQSRLQVDPEPFIQAALCADFPTGQLLQSGPAGVRRPQPLGGDWVEAAYLAWLSALWLFFLGHSKNRDFARTMVRTLKEVLATDQASDVATQLTQMQTWADVPKLICDAEAKDAQAPREWADRWLLYRHLVQQRFHQQNQVIDRSILDHALATGKVRLGRVERDTLLRAIHKVRPVADPDRWGLHLEVEWLLVIMTAARPTQDLMGPLPVFTGYFLAGAPANCRDEIITQLKRRIHRRQLSSGFRRPQPATAGSRPSA